MGGHARLYFPYFHCKEVLFRRMKKILLSALERPFESLDHL
jgi:hypothetical protein